MIGTSLGPYQVVAKLGEGGMGEVYRAKDSKLKREVALKVLPADVANDRERLARFQREGEVLASLNHPNIAAIYGIEEGPAEAGHHIGADVASDGRRFLVTAGVGDLPAPPLTIIVNSAALRSGQ